MERPVSLLILATMFISVFGQDPIVTITETNPESVIGRSHLSMQSELDQDVTMLCYVENKPPDTQVQWEFAKNTADPNKPDVTVAAMDSATMDSTRYSIEQPTPTSWMLRVKAIQPKDEGNYTCKVYATQVTQPHDTREVFVRDPPHLIFEQTSSDMTVNKEDNVELKCNATGRPAPRIQWTRLGGALLPIGKEVHYNSLLNIENIQPDHRGTYRCRAFNEINGRTREVIRDIALDVRFPPIVTALHKTVSQKVGCYRIELQCLVEANPFPQDELALRWLKGLRTISSSIGRHEIRVIKGAFNRLTYELIFNGVEASDAGEYTCRIENEMGTSSDTVNFQIADEPQVSKKIGQVRPCTSGEPRATLTALLGLLILLAHVFT